LTSNKDLARFSKKLRKYLAHHVDCPEWIKFGGLVAIAVVWFFIIFPAGLIIMLDFIGLPMCDVLTWYSTSNYIWISCMFYASHALLLVGAYLNGLGIEVKGLFFITLFGTIILCVIHFFLAEMLWSEISEEMDLISKHGGRRHTSYQQKNTDYFGVLSLGIISGMITFGELMYLHALAQEE
jgi:hypothetical protein